MFFVRTLLPAAAAAGGGSGPGPNGAAGFWATCTLSVCLHWVAVALPCAKVELTSDLHFVTCSMRFFKRTRTSVVFFDHDAANRRMGIRSSAATTPNTIFFSFAEGLRGLRPF